MAPIPDELRQQMEDWLASVKAFVDEVAVGFMPEERRNVNSLVDHSEALEGLRALAWMLENRDGAVAPQTGRRLVELVGDLVAAEHYPPSARRLLEAK